MSERLDAAGRTEAAAGRVRLGRRPDDAPPTEVILRALSAQFSARTLRELVFCGIEAVLGPCGIVILAAVLGLPLFGIILAKSIPPFGRAHAHPSRPLVLFALAVTPFAAAILVPLAARALGTVHRWLAARLLGERIAKPPARTGGGALRRLDALLRDGLGWKATGYLLLKLPLTLGECYAAFLAIIGVANLSYPLWWNVFVSLTAGPGRRTVPVLTPFGSLRVETFPGTCAACGIGIAMVLAAPWIARACCFADKWLMRAMLAPGELAQRVANLEESRTLAVEDSAALLRRLERDLHDGAQIRLVTLAMNLGMARDKLGDDADPVVRELVDAAHCGAKDAIAELRNLARGIHPPVLDSGLADALATLVVTSVIPAALRTAIAARPTPAIETIAYFCAAELLANAVKHSGASKILVEVTGGKAKLELRVSDDGQGGASAALGGGLSGLTQRVRTVDGGLDIVSPAGGPTVVTVRLPVRA
jgi:signal transduction histidine kinase